MNTSRPDDGQNTQLTFLETPHVAAAMRSPATHVALTTEKTV